MNLRTFLHYMVNPRTRLKDLTASSSTPPEKEKGERPQAARRRSVFNPPLVLGSVILLILIFVMLFGPLFSNHDHYITVRSLVQHYDKESGKIVKPPFEPSAEYPFGTDLWGNDILSLLAYGARVTLTAAAYITLARLVLGTMLGLLAGWYSGKLIDRAIMLVSGVITSIPLLLSSMILILALGIKNGLSVFLIALTIAGWTEIAEHVRGQTMIIREKSFIEGARAVGLTPIQTLIRHVLPNLLPHLIVIAFLDMGSVLLLLAELGFLGVYIGGGSTFSLDSVFGKPSQLVEVPEWGAILAQGTPSLRTYPYMVLTPSLAFFIAILGLNTFGEGLRRLLDHFSLNTALLLRKRTAVAAVALALLMALILELTGPELSYRRVADTFSGDQASQYAGELREVAFTSPSLQADYIAAQFKDMGLDRGIRFSINTTYQGALETSYLSPATTPYLAAIGYKDATAQEPVEFNFERDFTYVLRGPAGEGEAEAPLSVVKFQDLPPTALAMMSGRLIRMVNADGRILLVKEEGLPNSMLEGLIRIGAKGLLLVTAEEDTPLRAQDLVMEKAGEAEDASVPIYRIHPSVAEAILASGGLGLEVFDAPVDQPIGEVKTGIHVRMSLDLKIDSSQRFPVVIGYMPGYDGEIDKELVIVASSFDGNRLEQKIAPGPFRVSEGTAALLEVVRSWKAEKVDPRRSVLFVAWGSGTLDDPGFEEFIANPLNFTRLPTNSNQISEPEMLFGLEENTTTQQEVVIEAGVDEKLKDLFVTGSRLNGLRVSEEQIQTHERNITFEGERLQSILIQLPKDARDTGTSEQLSSLGQALSYALLNVTRQEIY